MPTTNAKISRSTCKNASLPPLSIAVISCECNREAYFTYSSDEVTNEIGQVTHELLSHFEASLKGVTPEKYRSVDFTMFDATKFQFPADPSSFDGLLIPGSLSSAFSDVEWVVKLRERIGRLPRTQKALCICFGHQLFAHARGGAAVTNPLGPTLFEVECSATTPKGKELFGDEKYLLLSSHCDIVETPGRDGVTLLSSSRTEHQVLGYFNEADEAYAFSIQSHPEYCCGGKAILDGVAKMMGVSEAHAAPVNEQQCAESAAELMKKIILSLWG